MTEHNSHAQRRTDAKLWVSLAVAVIAGAVTWGSLQQTVADHGRRLEQIERGAEKRIEIDSQILQRLTAIETKLEDVRSNMKVPR